MENVQDNFLETCLFFNANALSRHLAKLAEAEFQPLKLSAAHASLLLLVYDTPGLTPKVLSQLLQLNPSTVTRFIDALVKKGILEKENQGKQILIHPTARGLALRPRVAQAYKRLYLRYVEILGETEALKLSLGLAQANHRVRQALALAQEDASNL